jgi:uncharacterized RDD family membrane protein YckC
MGTVYAAEHVPDHRVVALKVLSADVDQLDARDRFLREGRAAAAVNHPNTVYVYGTEEVDGRLAISMELVADGTLEDRVRSRGPLPVHEVVEYAAQMIDGLAAAHDAGLLHRDVKPSNCFVAADGTLKVGDFGLSKPIDAGEQLRLTQTGVFLGTPVYSSPEQLLGETLDLRSDIYAVGLTLYFALTGRLPFPSGSMMQVVAAVLNGAPVPIATLRPDVSAEVADVVMKAIARRPEDRFQSYDAFRSAVVALRAPTFVPAPLEDRLRAWVVDGLCCGVVSLGVMFLVPPLRRATFGSAPDGPDPVATLIELCVALLVVAVPEGLRGTSPGKWLLRVQVVRSDGRRPGLTRACARAALLWACYPVADLAHALSGRSSMYLAVALLVRLALLGTARRANGWRTVYDRISGTHVVQPVAAHHRPRTTVRTPRPAVHVSGAGVGPYVVIPGGEVCDGCTLGWDPHLQRSVWLVTRHPGEPAVGGARRAVARGTRLRWVGGESTHSARWDAYADPGGEPFLRRLERPVSWEELRGWIDDLSSELLAAEQDGSLPFAPSIESLWLGAGGGLLIADIREANGGADGTTRHPRDLLAELIARVRHSGRLPTPLPPFATEALDAAASHPREAREALAPTAGRPVVVSRRKRTWMLGATLMPAPLFALLITSVISGVAAADPAGAQLDALLGFVARDSDRGSAFRLGTGWAPGRMPRPTSRTARPVPHGPSGRERPGTRWHTSAGSPRCTSRRSSPIGRGTRRARWAPGVQSRARTGAPHRSRACRGGAGGRPRGARPRRQRLARYAARHGRAGEPVAQRWFPDDASRRIHRRARPRHRVAPAARPRAPPLRRRADHARRAPRESAPRPHQTGPRLAPCRRRDRPVGRLPGSRRRRRRDVLTRPRRVRGHSDAVVRLALAHRAHADAQPGRPSGGHLSRPAVAVDPRDRA